MVHGGFLKTLYQVLAIVVDDVDVNDVFGLVEWRVCNVSWDCRFGPENPLVSCDMWSLLQVSQPLRLPRN